MIFNNNKLVSIATVTLAMLGATQLHAQSTYVIATGSTGGTSYYVGSAVAQVVNQNSDTIQLEVLPTSGTTEQAASILRERAQFTLLPPSSIIDAYEGKGDFAGNPVESLRLGWGGYYNYHNLIAPVRAEVTAWTDLAGKKVGMCPQATTCSKISTLMLQAAGLDLSDVSPQYISFNESVAALADRKLDAASIFGGVPSAAILNATSQMDIAFVPLTPEMQSAATSANPGFIPLTLPANSYAGQTEDVPTIGTSIMFVISADVSDAVISEMSDILYNHPDELTSIMPLMAFFNRENALSLDTPFIPRHDGVQAWYDANGMK